MSERGAEQVHPCCPHCADAKEDHVEHGGSVAKNRHEVSCSLCDRASAQFQAGIEASLGLLKRFPTTEGQQAGMAAAIVLVESLLPTTPPEARGDT